MHHTRPVAHLHLCEEIACGRLGNYPILGCNCNEPATFLYIRTHVWEVLCGSYVVTLSILCCRMKVFRYAIQCAIHSSSFSIILPHSPITVYCRSQNVMSRCLMHPVCYVYGLIKTVPLPCWSHDVRFAALCRLLSSDHAISKVRETIIDPAVCTETMYYLRLLTWIQITTGIDRTSRGHQGRVGHMVRSSMFI